MLHGSFLCHCYPCFDVFWTEAAVRACLDGSNIGLLEGDIIMKSDTDGLTLAEYKIGISSVITALTHPSLTPTNENMQCVASWQQRE